MLSSDFQHIEGLCVEIIFYVCKILCRSRAVKVAATDMRYFVKSTFSRGLVRKQNFDLVWQAVFILKYFLVKISRITFSHFVWSFDFSLHPRNTLAKYTPNDRIKIMRCRFSSVSDDDIEESELKLPHQEFLIFLGSRGTF